jgi:CubicO group peptidase (beta-lactamase class C family)
MVSMKVRTQLIARALAAGFVLAATGPMHAQTLDAPERLGDGLEAASPKSTGLQSTPLMDIRTAVSAGTFPKTTSVLIVKDSKLVFEEYFNGGGREFLNDTRSAMKSVAALSVGAALADGKLKSTDELAFRWLADRAPFKNDGGLKQQITLADFLTMSSALDCDDWDERNPGNEENMYPLSDWTRWAVDIPVKADYQRDAAGRGPFSYCTAGVFLLGQIVQRATKESVDQYVERRMLAPLGVKMSEWPRSPSGEVMTGGGLRLRSRDLAKLGVLVLSEGRWRGRQILPADWLAEVLTVRRRIDDNTSYGYLFWRREYRSRCGPLEGWYMSGNGGNVVVLVPSEKMVVVVTRQHYNQRGMHEQTLRLLEDHAFAALTCTRGQSL